MKKPKYNLTEVKDWSNKYKFEQIISKKDIILRGTEEFEGVEIIGKISKNFVSMKTIEVKKKLPEGTEYGWKYLREIKDKVYLCFSELNEYY